MTLLLALILASSAPQPASSDPLVGSWINHDPATGGVPQVVVRREHEDLLVHAWGKCHPTDCDWGETKIVLWNSLPTCTWDHGFAVTKMELVLLPDQRLLRLARTAPGLWGYVPVLTLTYFRLKSFLRWERSHEQRRS